jgi:hypothetical protein
MFANLHDTFKINVSSQENSKFVTTDIPEEIKRFYNENEIDFK